MMALRRRTYSMGGPVFARVISAQATAGQIDGAVQTLVVNFRSCGEAEFEACQVAGSPPV